MTAPQGRVTFLFTDIEGSTRLWERAPEAMRQALAQHDALFHQLIAERQGVVFKTIGDAFCAAFATTDAAVATALAGQRALASLDFPETGPLRVRMALHTGEPELRDGDYFGPPVNRVARLLSAGHGGQILISETVTAALGPGLGNDLSLTDLGVHSLRDVADPIHIWQLNVTGLAREFPPLKTLDYDPTNVPAPLTSFVGRDNLLGDLAAMLREPTVRLVTLTGPGGIGKTRLASQLAAQSRDDFPDGRYLVSLAAIIDPALVLDAIATTLGVPDDLAQAKTEALHAWLRPRRALLILDNFEQVLDAAPLVPAMLRAAPHLRVVATSREALRVYGEHEVEVPVLTLPDPARKLAPDELVAYDAIALFVQRAQSIRRTFTLTATNAPAIATICQRLDGLPLAIELAAARSRLFSPQQMLERLNDRLGFLTDGSRDLSERQQSLRAAIQWSYDLLNPPAQALFRQLSVFAGGMTLEAVTAVAGGDDADPLEMIDAVEALVDQSLLRESGATDDEPRFTMLETLREFAREQLCGAGEEEAALARHAVWYASSVDGAFEALRGNEQHLWLDRLETEHDNLRATLDWAIQHDPTMALRVCNEIFRFWEARGHIREGRVWTDRALEAGASSAPASLRSRLHWVYASLAICQGDVPAAEEHNQAALDLANETGNDAVASRALDALANIAHDLGDYDRSERLHDEAATRARAAGDPYLEMVAVGNMAAIAYYRGDYAGAEARWRETLPLLEQIGDRRTIAQIYSNLGAAVVDQGDMDRAEPLYEQALAIQYEVGSQQDIAFSLINQAEVLRYRGNYEAAIAGFAEAIALLREVGDERSEGVALVGCGMARYRAGDAANGLREMREGLASLHRSGDHFHLINGLEAIALIAATGCDPAAGARLYGAARRLRAEIGATAPGADQPELDRGLAAAKTALGADRFTREWAAGQALDRDAAAAAALEFCAKVAAVAA